MLDFAAELHCEAHLRSEARSLPCMSSAWNSGSLRNFTAELTSAAKRGSTAWIFIAELYLHAKRGASQPISVIITIILVISPGPERTRAQI